MWDYIYLPKTSSRGPEIVSGRSDQRIILALAVIQFSFPFLHLPNPDSWPGRLDSQCLETQDFDGFLSCTLY